MIRVLSVLHGATFGGPHNHNQQIDAALKARGVQTTVVLPDEPGNAEERLRSAGLAVEVIPLGRFRVSRNPLKYLLSIARVPLDVWRLMRLIRKHDADVVVLNGLINPHAAIAARLLGKAVVWQILDTRPPAWFRRIMMMLVRWLANATMSTGHATFHAHAGWQAMADRNVVFFPPVDVERFSANARQRAQARERLGIAEDEWVLGCVANINPQKGLPDFVRSAAALVQELPKARFVILGKTYPHFADYLQHTQDLAAQLGLRWGERIQLLDPQHDVQLLAQSFDLFWFTPEPRSEGMPTVIGEAFALGLPAVCYAAGSMAEAVLNDQTGYIATSPQEMADRTLRIYRDPELYRRLSAGARAFAERNYATQHCVQAQLDAYRQAFAHKGQRLDDSGPVVTLQRQP